MTPRLPFLADLRKTDCLEKVKHEQPCLLHQHYRNSIPAFITDEMGPDQSQVALRDDQQSTQPIEQLAVEEDPHEFELTGLGLITVMSGLVLAIFLVSLDSAIVATAVPYVTAEFKSAGDTAWYGSAYTLATCALQPIAGKLYAKFPIKVKQSF